jgi:hypothetical protein
MRASIAAGLCLLAPILGTGCGGRAGPRPAATAVRPAAPAVIYHPLRPGQTLYTLARMYDVSVEELMEANGITDPTNIPADTPIFIPRATRKLPYPEMITPALAWPLRGTITGAFGRRRGRRSPHTGIDIDGERGDPILAAADGEVIKAGSGGRYGKLVILKHANGFQTLYAHASRLLVRQGQRVRAGDPIAEVGSSGNARGSHLHFEVRREGRPQNPLPYLRGTPIETTDH